LAFNSGDDATFAFLGINIVRKKAP